MSKESIDRDNYQNNTIPIGNEIKKRKEFSDREVGLTHPDLSSFIRLNDRGDIEIFVAPGVGIVLSAKSKSISFFSDSVRFFTKEDGFRWNSYNFNYCASSYIEPTLVKINHKNIHSATNGVAYYLNNANTYRDQEEQIPITIVGEYGFSQKEQHVQQIYQSDYSLDGLTDEQIALLEIYRTDHSKEHILLMIEYIKAGSTFEQAHVLASKETNE
jgi:hypothetical protein